MEIVGYKQIKKIYGPYKHSDGNGRKNVILVFTDDTRKTVSYARWLMEQHLGRSLNTDEEVDHINRDCTDDRLENLQVLHKSLHISVDAFKVKDIPVTCVWCGTEFLLEGRKIKDRNRGKAGPFCSKSCTGKYGAAVQNGKIEKFDPQTHKREKFYKEKID